MTRIEENQKVIDEMAIRVSQKPSGTYEEMMIFQTGVIANMLTDISRSLAILADKNSGKSFGELTIKETHAVREEVKAIEKELHNLNRIQEKRKI